METLSVLDSDGNSFFEDVIWNILWSCIGMFTLWNTAGTSSHLVTSSMSVISMSNSLWVA